MKKGSIRLRGLRILVLLWASLWMLAIPLFHVHPAVDHRHGGALHAHGVIVHTVLSLDVAGEFDDHHDVDPSEEAAASISLVEHHSHSFNEHPEVGFALLNDSSDRKVFKPFLAQALAIGTNLAPSPDRQICTETNSTPIRASTILVHEIRPRAPPTCLT